jgi:hypothetical protein
MKNGSRSRTRTYDRAINSRLLYQLSYPGSGSAYSGGARAGKPRPAYTVAPCPSDGVRQTTACPGAGARAWQARRRRSCRSPAPSGVPRLSRPSRDRSSHRDHRARGCGAGALRWRRARATLSPAAVIVRVGGACDAPTLTPGRFLASSRRTAVARQRQIVVPDIRRPSADHIRQQRPVAARHGPAQRAVAG